MKPYGIEQFIVRDPPTSEGVRQRAWDAAATCVPFILTIEPIRDLPEPIQEDVSITISQVLIGTDSTIFQGSSAQFEIINVLTGNPEITATATVIRQRP